MQHKPAYTGRYVPESIISKIVSDVTNVPKEMISLPDKIPNARKRETICARQLSMYFYCLHTRNSLARIGLYHGNRDHATVLHACKTVNGYLDVNDPIVIPLYANIKNRLSLYGIRRKMVSKPFKQPIEKRIIRLKHMIRNRVPLDIREKILISQYN